MILALDTAMAACSVGVFDAKDQSPLWQSTEIMTRGHQEALGTMCYEAFAAMAITGHDVTRIIVTIGPGSFTGLRIGLSFAKGLAVGANAPLIGVNCLEAMGAGITAKGAVLSLMQGGKGFIYGQILRDQRAVSEILSLDLSDEAALKTLGEIEVITGPQAQDMSLHFPDARAVSQASPSLAAMVELGMAKPYPYDVTPVYMREADAKPSSKPVWQASA